MNFIFRIVLRLPLWLFIILAAGLFFLGTKTIGLLEAENAQLAQAQQATPPELIDFKPGAISGEGEVALRLKIDEEDTYRFLYEGDGAEDYVEYFHFVTSPNSTADGTEYAAVLLFETDQAAKMQAWLEAASVESTSTTDIVEFQGWASTDDFLTEEVSEALYWLSGTRAENFVYIRPYLDGRDAFFAESTFPVDLIEKGLWGAVALLLAFGAGKSIVIRKLKFLEGNEPEPSKAKTATKAVGVAAGVAGLAGLTGDDEEDEDDGFLSGGGIFVSAAKLIFGFWLKRKASKKQSEPTQPELQMPDPVVEPEVVSASTSVNMVDGIAMYTPPPREPFLPEDAEPEPEVEPAPEVAMIQEPVFVAEEIAPIADEVLDPPAEIVEPAPVIHSDEATGKRRSRFALPKLSLGPLLKRKSKPSAEPAQAPETSATALQLEQAPAVSADAPQLASGPKKARRKLPNLSFQLPTFSLPWQGKQTQLDQNDPFERFAQRVAEERA